MTTSIAAITTPRIAGSYWKVKDDKIIQHSDKSCGLVKLIHLIRSMQFAAGALSATALSGADVERVYTPLKQACSKLTLAIQKKSWIQRFILVILQYVFTGTTLSQAINPIKTIYLQKLISDAEYALQDSSCNVDVERKYELPSIAAAYTTAIELIINPLLYHLKQAFTREWQELVWQLEAGKTLQSPACLAICDKAMEIGLLLTKLSLKYELVALHEKKHPEICPTKESLAKLLANQGGYPYWVLNLVGQFYIYIRSYPTYHNNKWHSSYTEARPFMQQFYQEGSRPAQWRKTFNNICRQVPEHVNREVFLACDSRFYIDEDTQQDKVVDYDHDNYAETQLFTNTW